MQPLAPPWSREDATDIGSWGHPDRTYEPLLLVRCLQRHPNMARKLRKMGESLYLDTRLPPRTRTIAILRICGLVRCAYEWGGQAAFWGPIAGVSPTTRRRAGRRRRRRSAMETTTNARSSTRSTSWSAPARGRTPTWAALGDSLDDEQRMELLIAVGWYRTICTLCNGLELPVEGWMRHWPVSAD